MKYFVFLIFDEEGELTKLELKFEKLKSLEDYLKIVLRDKDILNINIEIVDKEYC